MELRLRFPPTPTYAPAHAELVVEIARREDGVDLDYTPTSLARVDQIIEAFRQEGIHEADIAETLFTFGCYVGEIFVRHAGGLWKEASQSQMARVVPPDAWMVVELPNSTVVNPIGKVFKRLTHGPTESLSYFYQVFVF